MVKCFASGHDPDSNPHSADRKHQSLSQVLKSPQPKLSALVLIARSYDSCLDFTDTFPMVGDDEDGKIFLKVSHHYASNIKSYGNVSNASRARRLAQEAVTLSTSLPLSACSSVFVRCDDERLDVMKVRGFTRSFFLFQFSPVYFHSISWLPK